MNHRLAPSRTGAVARVVSLSALLLLAACGSNSATSSAIPDEPFGGASGSPAGGGQGHAGTAGHNSAGTGGKSTGGSGGSGGSSAGSAGKTGTGGAAGIGGTSPQGESSGGIGGAPHGGASGASGASGSTVAGGSGGASGTMSAGGATTAGGNGGSNATGGKGGTSATGGTSGTGGGTGGPCNSPGDCPGSDDECQTRTCDSHQCGISFAASGTPTAQSPGDCEKSQCDGKGHITTVPDTTDPQNDQNLCTDDICKNGGTSHIPVAEGTSCGKLKCNSIGQCIGCGVAADCPGTDDECKSRSCSGTVCGWDFAAAGVKVKSQTPGDCTVSECDGSGAVMAVTDTQDTLDDGNDCTDDTCVGQTPTSTNSTGGAVCKSSGGSVCDGNGACVACVDAASCPSPSTVCQVATCNAGMCGFDNVATGSPVGTQTDGDCLESQCDGNGKVLIVNQDADVNDDLNACTDDACNSGTPTHVPVGAGAPCGASLVCDANGQCTGCGDSTECPAGDDCRTPTCDSNVCGFSLTPKGTTTSNQVDGDCKENQCDGKGNTIPVNVDADTPDDNNSCTSDLCKAGVPSNPSLPPGTSCSGAINGSVCNAVGVCVGCVSAATCPGSDDACGVRTCIGNNCGFSFTAVGTIVGVPIAGDCLQTQCDGGGNTLSVPLDSDVPVDKNDCTADVCTAGSPSNPLLDPGVLCSQNGGSYCDGSGACVECITAATCPAPSGLCRVATCDGTGTCGIDDIPMDTTVGVPVLGDCKDNQCDGSGHLLVVNLDSDVPDDKNDCTDDVCTDGAPSNPNSSVNTPCSQNGGLFCNGTGACLECNDGTECASGVCKTGSCAAPACDDTVLNGDETAADCGGTKCPKCSNGMTCLIDADCLSGSCGGSCQPVSVLSTTPADGTIDVAVTSKLAVTFTGAVKPSSITIQSLPGACTGSLQVSTDAFVTCIGLSSLTISGGNTVATVTATPGLSFGSSYATRVTIDVVDSTSQPIGLEYNSPLGITTAIDTLATCNSAATGAVVISQVYAGGGNAGATYLNDFVELHNRSDFAVTLTGMSLQYITATAFSTKINLTGSVAAGGYFLVALGSGGAVGAALPAPDQSAGLNMANGDRGISLVSTTTAITACDDPTILDLVGWGGAFCKETTAAANLPASNTSALFRAGAGCNDSDVNSADFTAAAALPRNSGTKVLVCACGTESTANESGDPAEIDYCVLQSPTGFSVQTGVSSGAIYGRVYELNVTEAAGASSEMEAQVGYGPLTVNPENQSGWVWSTASYNAGFVDPSNDEYQGSFTAPAVGTYAYAFRFRVDGVNWTYCDVNGAGYNPGLSFEVTQLPVLTVTP